MPSFSILICTYNPDPVIFKRLLNAVLQFDAASPAHEVIIIDNNSSPSLSFNKDVQTFLVQKLSAQVVTETTPGLTAARIAGISKAAYEWVVFFDDDNEPAADYLTEAAKNIDQYPQVGAWGPGKIQVEYTDPVESWFETRKELFQQKHWDKTLFTNEASWQDCYPFGTGMIIRKDIAVEYKARVQAGRYTLTDRKGKSLASGGDVQMLLTGIEMGFYAGSIAPLRLNHLINSSKATLAYLQKQQYGTASAYIKAYNQVFTYQPLKTGKVTNLSLLKMMYSLYRIQGSILNKNDFKLLLATKLGEMYAAVSASDQPKPILLKWYERMTNV